MRNDERADAGLVHETPALTVRPLVALRPAPGMTLRIPARAATIVGVGAVIWGGLAAVTPLAWELLAAGTLAPLAALAALAEVRVRGRAIPALAVIALRHVRRVKRARWSGGRSA